MSDKDHTSDTRTSVNELPLVLDTGLFDDRDTLSAALQLLDLPSARTRKLNPTTMKDGDWDDILNLVLSAKRVITL